MKSVKVGGGFILIFSMVNAYGSVFLPFTFNIKGHILT